MKEIRDVREVVQIKWAKVREDAIIPTKRDEDAGYDVYANFEDEYIAIPPHETVMIPTGIASAIPNDYFFQVEERGSTGTIGMKKSSGIIDSGYRGEWFIPISNVNDKFLYITKEVDSVKDLANAIYYPYSKAIAQAVLLPVPRVNAEVIPYEELEKIPSARGKSALGDSGK